jgi:hypothetical protein
MLTKQRSGPLWTQAAPHLIHHKVHSEQLKGVGQGHECTEIAPEGVDDVGKAVSDLLGTEKTRRRTKVLLL